jgi:hypothetical protein
MKYLVVPALAMLLTAAGTVSADVKSGLAVGEDVGPFEVKDCTGPAKGKPPLCYR